MVPLLAWRPNEGIRDVGFSNATSGWPLRKFKKWRENGGCSFWDDSREHEITHLLHQQGDSKLTRVQIVWKIDLCQVGRRQRSVCFECHLDYISKVNIQGEVEEVQWIVLFFRDSNRAVRSSKSKDSPCDWGGVCVGVCAEVFVCGGCCWKEGDCGDGKENWLSWKKGGFMPFDWTGAYDEALLFGTSGNLAWTTLQTFRRHLEPESH